MTKVEALPFIRIAVTLSVLALGVAADPGAASIKSVKYEENPCRLFLAPSTIPGAGMGIFAGVDFAADDTVLPGDIVMPIDDLPFHTGSASWAEGVPVFFMWGDYSWDSSIVAGASFDYEGLSVNSDGEEPILEGVEMASPGIGAMPNCKFGFVNLRSDFTKSDMANEDRNSPANGAFTPYHDRVGKAQGRIDAGSEIFEDYGPDYFAGRPELTDIPHEEDYESANVLLGGLRQVRRTLRRRRGRPVPVSPIIRDLYDVVKSFWNGSRVLNALPDLPYDSTTVDNSLEDLFLDDLLNRPVTVSEKKKTIRDLNWLREEGICMDGIRAGTSDIEYAGRGAFATRGFQEGDRIAPVPLIHIPYRSIMKKYAPKVKDGKVTKLRNISNPLGTTQLLENYCFGHKNSTMLLSPYGHITSLVNHGSGKKANARMVWAKEWMREPDGLKMRPEVLERAQWAGLGFDLVALREIKVDEEVLIDYGKEWEDAWTKHVSDWYAQETIPTGTSSAYVPAKQLNKNKEQILLEIVEGKVDYMYMGHGVSLNCYYYGATIPAEDEDGYSGATHECRPVKSYKSLDTGEQLFVAELVQWTEIENEWTLEVLDVMWDCSPTIFFFQDIPYTLAHQMTWSFRHAMAIPDDIFPDAWMNLK